MREALVEREILWRIAPHIIWPVRFVLPLHKGLRPAWLLRLGLFLYDHLGGRRVLPPTESLRLDQDSAGEPLKPEFTRGFEYSDCWVERFASRCPKRDGRLSAGRGDRAQDPMPRRAKGRRRLETDPARSENIRGQ